MRQQSQGAVAITTVIRGMDHRGKRQAAATSLITLLSLAMVTVGQNAVAQDVLGAGNTFNGANFGTVGASGYGAGPIGGNRVGLGLVSFSGAGRTNSTRLELSTGAGETDNVFLRSSGKQSQTLAIAGLDVALIREKPRLNASVSGTFEDLYYAQNAFGNQLIGSFSGDVNLGLVPNRLYWVTEESYGQNVVNPLEPTIASNLQNVNVVTTGPDLLLHPGNRANFLQLGARYVRSDYEVVPFGGHGVVGLLALGRDVSQTSAMALHIADKKMYFNNTIANQNYSLRKAYGSFRARGARTAIELEGGAAQVDDKPSKSSVWTTRPIAQVRITRRLSPSMTVSLQGGRQVTDSADSFAALQSGAGGVIAFGPTYGTTSSYLETYGSIAWTFVRNRTSMDASVSWKRSSYDLSSLLDTKIENYTFGIARRLTRRLEVQLTANLAKTDYFDAQSKNNTRTVNVALRWRVAPKLQAAFQYQYSSQSSSQLYQTLTRSGYFNLFALSSVRLANEYSANSVFLMLTYMPFGG